MAERQAPERPPIDPLLSEENRDYLISKQKAVEELIKKLSGHLPGWIDESERLREYLLEVSAS